MRSRGQYLEYIDSADPRKLPNEVMEAIEAGTAARLVDPSLQAVKEARASAQARLAADKTELPALQRDAGAAGAKLVTVMAAADTLLSYGKAAEAEAPGVGPLFQRGCLVDGKADARRRQVHVAGQEVGLQRRRVLHQPYVDAGQAGLRAGPVRVGLEQDVVVVLDGTVDNCR